ncbi:MAG: hypothetical protein VB858_07650, partial [Planctomycetaceae bacterium]
DRRAGRTASAAWFATGQTAAVKEEVLASDQDQRRRPSPISDWSPPGCASYNGRFPLIAIQWSLFYPPGS